MKNTLKTIKNLRFSSVFGFCLLFLLSAHCAFTQDNPKIDIQNLGNDFHIISDSGDTTLHIPFRLINKGPGKIIIPPNTEYKFKLKAKTINVPQSEVNIDGTFGFSPQGSVVIIDTGQTILTNFFDYPHNQGNNNLVPGGNIVVVWPTKITPGPPIIVTDSIKLQITLLIPNGRATAPPQNTLGVYPNPAISLVKIQLDEPITAVLAHTMAGRLYKRFEGTQNLLDVSDWFAGLYLLEIRTASGLIYYQKFLKKE